MRFDNRIGAKLFLLAAAAIAIFSFSQTTSASSISGIVYDNKRNPLNEVDIELLDDYYRSINRTKTNATGRYEFSGLGDGRYTVKVMAFRYDFNDESSLVEINTMTSVPGQVGNTFITQDFYLTPRKGSMADSENGVVFAQEVPKDAQRFFDSASKSLARGKRDDAVVDLRKAVDAFPKYFLALQNLGKLLFDKGEYGEALQILMRASEVNQKSPTTFYYMGYSLLKLNYTKAALIPLNQAIVLAPSATQILYALALAEMGEAKYEDAEKHFLQAKKLSKTDVADIHWQLAQLYGNNMKKYKEAADELELYLKAAKPDAAQSAKVKKVIADLREKAKKA